MTGLPSEFSALCVDGERRFIAPGFRDVAIVEYRKNELDEIEACDAIGLEHDWVWWRVSAVLRDVRGFDEWRYFAARLLPSEVASACRGQEIGAELWQLLASQDPAIRATVVPLPPDSTKLRSFAAETANERAQKLVGAINNHRSPVIKLDESVYTETLSPSPSLLVGPLFDLFQKFGDSIEFLRKHVAESMYLRERIVAIEAALEDGDATRAVDECRQLIAFTNDTSFELKVAPNPKAIASSEQVIGRSDPKAVLLEICRKNKPERLEELNELLEKLTYLKEEENAAVLNSHAELNKEDQSLLAQLLVRNLNESKRHVLWKDSASIVKHITGRNVSNDGSMAKQRNQEWGLSLCESPRGRPKSPQLVTEWLQALKESS